MAGKKVLMVLSKADCRYKGREIDPGRLQTFEELDHEIISTAILLPSADSRGVVREQSDRAHLLPKFRRGHRCQLL